MVNVGARVLVVDDDEQIRVVCRAILEQEGYLVEEAANGREALQMARKSAFDAVICDIFMPEKDGLETIVELRRDFPSVRIVVITGGGLGGRLSYSAVALRLGAAVVLHKPFTPAELVASLKSRRM